MWPGRSRTQIHFVSPPGARRTEIAVTANRAARTTMSLTCPKCGAENRDSAKFCLKCAQQLVPLGPSAPPPSAPNKRRRRRRSAESASGGVPAHTAETAKPPLRWLLVVGALIVAAVAAWAFLRAPASSRTAVAPAGSQASTSTPAVPASSVPALASPAPTRGASAPAPDAQTPAAPASASPVANPVSPGIEAAHAAPATAAAQPAPPVTKRADRNTTRGDKPARASRQAPASAVVAAEPAPPPAEAPPPRPPAPAAAAPSGVLCADRRFIGHAVCLQSECNKPGMRQHPQCARMREQQDAVRSGSGEN